MNLTDLYHVRRALEAYEHSRGRDHLPAGFLTFLDGLRALDEDIGRLLPPWADTGMDSRSEPAHSEVVPYEKAAQMLGLTSTRSIGRYVKAGKLVRVGRKVTRASLRALLAEGE